MLDDLLTKIISLFPNEGSYNIELSVLTNDFEYLDIYKGFLGLLTVSHLEKQVNKPGCFYSLQVIGVPEDLNLNKDMVERKNIIRREFCWLTEPSQPVIRCLNPHALNIQWNHIEFNGFKSSNSCNIRYHIEIATGPDYQNNIHSKYIVENLKKVSNHLEFIDLYNTSTFNNINIFDLKPAKWYIIRLVVNYNGTSKFSERVIMNTSCTVPNPPSIPRLYCSLSNSYDSNNLDKSNLVLRWSPNDKNGSDIIKYQVQLQEKDINGNIIIVTMDKPNVTEETNILPPLTNSPNKTPKNRKNNNKNIKPIITYTTYTSKWKTVYMNQTNKCYLPLPNNNISEWIFRVRACNEYGWSEFSEILIVNAKQFPTLFTLSPYNSMNYKVDAIAIACLHLDAYFLSNEKESNISKLYNF